MFWDVPECSGMLRNVPACSGMFHVPGFIDGRFHFKVVRKSLYFYVSLSLVVVSLFKF